MSMADASSTQRDALIVHVPSLDWARELGALPKSERQQRRADLMQSFERRLQPRLTGLDLELERLAAVGSWVVRGTQATLERLRGPQSPLLGSEFEIVQNQTFRSS